MKVEGTDGVYILETAFEAVTHPETTSTVPSPNVLAGTATAPTCPTPPTPRPNNPFEICSTTGALEIDRYLLNIAEPGTLIVHSRAKTGIQIVDVVGTALWPGRRGDYRGR